MDWLHWLLLGLSLILPPVAGYWLLRKPTIVPLDVLGLFCCNVLLVTGIFVLLRLLKVL